MIFFGGGGGGGGSAGSPASKIQASVLASIQPLTSAGLALVNGGLEETMVKGNDVLLLIQCTLCMVGNASNLISDKKNQDF